MITSALLAVSACTVTPFAENALPPEDGGENGSGGCPAGCPCAAAAATPPAPPIANAPDGASEDGPGVDAGPSLPVRSARSVCATRAASAFLR